MQMNHFNGGDPYYQYMIFFSSIGHFPRENPHIFFLYLTGDLAAGVLRAK